MPIKFACPNCQQQLEVSRQYAGQQFKCPKCQNAVTAPSAPGGGPAPTPSPTHASASGGHDDDPASSTALQSGRRRGGGGGGKMKVFSPPRNRPLFFLWLGLLLIMGGFVVKQIVVDLALSDTPSVLNYAKIESQEDAELLALNKKVDKLQFEYSQWQAEEDFRDRKRREKESDEKDFRKRSELRKEHNEAREKSRERRSDKLEEINDARDEVREERADIREKYFEKKWDAKLSRAESGASFLGWAKLGIWIKIILDLPKLIGCFLVLLASMPIAADPENDAGIKAYAIVCTAVVLLYGTLYSWFAFFG